MLELGIPRIAKFDWNFSFIQGGEFRSDSACSF